MTQNVETPVTSYALTGEAVGPWATVWTFASAGEVAVWLRLPDAADAQVDPGDVTVTGATPLENGGNVQIAADLVPDGGWPAGAAVLLVRQTLFTQPLAIGAAARVPLESIEKALDAAARRDQDLKRDLDRTFKTPIGTEPWELPAYDQFLQDAAELLTPEALEQIETAATDAENAAVAAINGQRDAAVEVVENKGAEVADSLGIVGGAKIRVVAAEAGFDGGVVIADPDGWTVDAKWLDRDTGTPGEVTLIIRSDKDFSGLPSAYRIYNIPPWSVTPTAVLSPASAVANDFKWMRNESAANDPSDNIFALPTGDMRSASTSSLTLTKQYAPGPAGGSDNTAMRVVATGVNGAMIHLNAVIPAGTWDLTAKYQGVTAGTTNVRRGSASSLTSDTVDDTTWKALPRDSSGIVSDGSTAINYQVRGDGSNLIDVKCDQLQGYPYGTTPSWTDEITDHPFAWHFKRPVATEGSITVDANDEIIMTGGVNFGYLIGADFPDPVLIDDICVHVMVDCTGGAANTRIFGTETASDLSTTTTTFYIGTSNTDGYLATGPVNTGSAGANILLKDAGPTILTYVMRDGHRGIYVNGQPVNVLNNAFTEFSARLFQLFGVSNGSGAVPGTFLDLAMHLGAAPTQDEITADVLKLIDRNATRWADGGTRNHFIYNGDSNMAPGVPGGSIGPSAFYVQGDYGYHSRPLFVTNLALSGSDHAEMKERWDAGGTTTASTRLYGDKQVCEASVAAGNNTIYGFNVSLANDQARFTPSLIGQLITDLKDWAAEVKEATGNPCVIIGAMAVNNMTADMLTARDTFNAAMLADSSPSGDYIYIDMSATTLWTWNTTDYGDDLHMRGNSAGNGQDKVKPLVQAAIDDLLAV
jgi:hypothetical protein